MNLKKDSKNYAEFEEEEPEEGFENYADRLYQLSLREFESEIELDNEISGILDGMEGEYFFGGLLKRAKKGLGKLIKKGKKYVSKTVKRFPAFNALKGITKLVRGDLRGLLASLIKSGLGTALRAHPAGAALQALGFIREVSDPEMNREAWENVSNVCKTAYDHLARNLNEDADDPLEASRLATNAFQAALKNAQIRPPSIRYRGATRRRIVKAKKGDTIIIKIV